MHTRPVQTGANRGVFRRNARVAATCLAGFLSFSAFPIYSGALAQDAPNDEIPTDVVIDGVFHQAIGVQFFNQDAGFGVNQGNALTAAITEGDAAIAEAISQSVSIGPETDPDLLLVRNASFVNAALEAQGVFFINQSDGLRSVQSNLAALASSTTGVSVASAISHAGGAPGSASQTGPLDGVAQIANVGVRASGLIAVNQDVGADNRQVNATALAFSQNGAAIASAAATFTGNPGADDSPNGAGGAGTLSLTDSFVDATGVVQVSQSVGGRNEQANLLAIAFGANSTEATALADTELDAVNAPPSDPGPDAPVVTFDRSGSFEGFSGIAQVSQTAGYGNQVVNAFAVSVTHVEGGL